ncbi:MAG: hypothetical protein R3223_07170 [Longimicrobiales bacterium]|nr:hypothetical protein [Longimicrobiales bacterium]
MAEKIVVDGSNVAHIETSGDGSPKISNIQAVRSALQDRGYDPVIIVDASLRHEIDDPQQLEHLLEDEKIHQAPSDTDADYFIVETADREGARIVSNDRYEEYQDDFSWIPDRRVPLMIIDGEVELYELGEAGTDEDGRGAGAPSPSADEGGG